MFAAGALLAIVGPSYFIYKGMQKTHALNKKQDRTTIPGYYEDASFALADAYEINYDKNQRVADVKSGIYGLPKTIVKGTHQGGHLNAWGKPSTVGIWQP